MTQELSARRQERVAWLVILCAALAFCVLAVSIPLAVKWYVFSATEDRPNTLEIIRGTVLVVRSGTRQEVNGTNRMALAAGDLVRTAPDSQALLLLADGSNIRLWPQSTLVINRSRTSRYNNNLTELLLELRDGLARVEVSLPPTEARLFELQTAAATAQLREGSYSVRVEGDTSDIAVRNGSASVTGVDQSIELLAHERTIVRRGSAPLPPTMSTSDILVNGDFGRSLSGWQSGNRDVDDNIAGEVSVLEQDGRNIVRFLRRGSSKHAATFIHQVVERDVTDYQSLKLSLDLKLVSQSLSGGGFLGSEYPLAVKVRYRDSNNNEATWAWGFYIQNTEGRPTPAGSLTARDIWLPFMIDLFDHTQVNPRPAHIIWIEVESSGWEYESYVSNLHLLAD